MVYAVHAELAFTTAQRRDQAAARVQNLAAKPRFGPLDVRSTEVEVGGPGGPIAPFGLELDLRFTTNADADALVADLRIRPGITAARIETHPCTHDGPLGVPCPAPTVTLLP